MLTTKLFEVRDEGTFIPVIATLVQIGNLESDEEHYLLRRSGYGTSQLVLVSRLSGGDSNYDVYGWHDGSRTIQQAHKIIEKRFKELPSGSVVDIQYELGETQTKKVSEACE